MTSELFFLRVYRLLYGVEKSIVGALANPIDYIVFGRDAASVL